MSDFLEVLARLFPENAEVAAMGGVLGGLVRVITLGGTTQGAACAMLVGGITAIYLGPAIIPMIEAIPFIGAIENAPPALGHFGAGLFGISITGALIDYARLKRQSISGANDDQA